MASLMEELIDVLEKECQIYDELLVITREKTQVIVADNMERLQEITDQEQDTLTTIHNLEKKREDVATDIAMVLGKDKQTLTITNIIDCLKNQPKDQKRLSEIHDRLSKVVHQLVDVNEYNQRLVNEVLEMIQFNMNVLQSTTMAPQTGAYNKGAYSSNTQMRQSGMFDTSR